MRFVSWKKKKATKSILPLLLRRPRTHPLPRCSFIHQFLYSQRPLVSLGAIRRPADGPARRPVCFPRRRPSLFYCPLGISPLPWFDPLRSLVIFGRVSDTSVCLGGNRSERPSGFCGAAAEEEGETRDGVVGESAGLRGNKVESNETEQADRSDDSSSMMAVLNTTWMSCCGAQRMWREKQSNRKPFLPMQKKKTSWGEMTKKKKMHGGRKDGGTGAGEGGACPNADRWRCGSRSSSVQQRQEAGEGKGQPAG